MNVKFTESALEELNFFRENEPDIFEKIKILIANIKEMPFKGLGKPEALKHNLQGYWSRRITLEHRLVYKIENDTIIVIQCRGHY
jgi:toxin YoeB